MAFSPDPTSFDDQVGDFKISSTFETASGTTNVEIKKSPFSLVHIAVIGVIAILVLFLLFVLFR